MDPVTINRFQAELRHHPAAAMRRLRRDPTEYLPLAFGFAASAGDRDGERIAKMLTGLMGRKNSRLFARLLFDGIPHGSHHLTGVAIEAGRVLLQQGRVRTEGDRHARAELWNSLSERYREAGQIRKGLACSKRSVRILRRLVSENRDFHPYLIIALQVLAKRHSEVGEHEFAVTSAEEAVSRALADTKDAITLRLYLQTLDTLAGRFEMAGDHRQTLVNAAKGLALTEDAIKSGALFDEELAGFHYRLATAYTNLDDLENALPHAVESRIRFQALAHQNAAAWEKLYFAANDLVVGARSSLGLPPDNEALRGESRAFFEERARAQPLANLPRYMRYLVRESAVVAEDIASNEAIDLAERAAAVAREIQQLMGDLVAEDEGHVYLHLAKLRRSRGEHSMAWTAGRKAVERFERVMTAKGIEWRLDALEFLAGFEPEEKRSTGSHSNAPLLPEGLG